MFPREIRSLGPAIVSMLGLCLMVAACSPTFDWRENVPAGSGLVTSFPCRPDHHSRAVQVAGSPVQMEMWSCSAGELLYAVSYFDVPAPAQVTEALAALHATLLDNVHAADPRVSAREHPVSAPRVKGVTPNLQSGAWAIEGQRPDGSSLSAQAAFFSRGLRIYQAAVVGSALGRDAVEPFFSGMKFPG